MKFFLLIFPLIFLAGCGDFMNSPFTDELQTKTRNWNSENIEKIRALNLNDTFKIATIADTHANYEDLMTLLQEINSRPDIDFVIHLGDFTERGYNYEYDIFVRAMKNLQKPFVVAIGNHDSVGKGPQMYQQVFGPLNFSFDFNGTKIIVANNNRLDFFSTWSAEWLVNEVSLSQNYDRVLVAHHVNPDSQVYFTPEQISRFDQLYSENNIDMVMNGHQHVFSFTEKQNYWSLFVPRAENHHYNVLEYQQGDLYVWTCEKQNCQRVSP